MYCVVVVAVVVVSSDYLLFVVMRKNYLDLPKVNCGDEEIIKLKP